MVTKWHAIQLQVLASGKKYPLEPSSSCAHTDGKRFGLGFNRCPREHLALIQMFKIAATIVRDYTVHQVDPEKQWEWEAYFTVVPHSWPLYIEKN